MYTKLPQSKPFARVLYALMFIGVLLGGSLAARAEPGVVQPLAPVAAQHSVYLPLIANPGTAPLPGGSTSDDLIAAAVASGEIDAETGLLYRVFAAYSDPRLPAKYHGDDRNVAGGGVMREVDQRLAGLKPATRAALQPFLLPPTAPGSWLELRSPAGMTASAAPAAAVQWDTVCATSSRIKVWYQRQFPEDAATARAICTEMETKVWPGLTGLMGHGPLSDIAEANNGGNEKFDIYLVERTRSQTRTYSERLEKTPTYMLINRGQYLPEHLARLFMEAILYSYENASPVHEVDWDFIGTSVWAMDFLYGGTNREHEYAWDYLTTTDFPLDYTRLDSPRTDGFLTSVQEGKYLWPFYLARIGATPLAIPKVWELGEQQPHLKAIDTAIGGWKQHWRNFSLYNWNHEPVDIYKAKDSLKEYARPKLKWQVQLDNGQSKRYEMPAQVRPLATEYYSFTFKDPSVRSVLLTNPFANGEFPHASVQAVYRIGENEIGVADWTGKQYVAFCRDLDKERVTELTIIVGNSDWQNHKELAPARPMTLDATNIGCRGWKVDAKFTYTDEGPTWKKTSTITTTATLERVIPSSGQFHTEFYKVTSGTATWTHKGHVGICSGSKSGSYDVVTPLVENNMIVETYNVSYLPPFAPGSRKYHAVGATRNGTSFETVTYVCPNQTFVEPANVEMWLETAFEAPLMQHDVGADGKTLKGSSTLISHPQVGTVTFTSEWTMTALPPE
jgi:hypothetical protein